MCFSFPSCLTSGNPGSDCVNGSVADRGSCAMIGLRICAFFLFFFFFYPPHFSPYSPSPPLSRDSKVTKIYNQMAYDTLATKGSREPSDRRGRRGGRFGAARLTSHCWPLLGRAVVCLYWKHDSKDTHASFSRQKVVKDGIWRLDLIDRHYMVKMERGDEKNDAFRAKLWRQTATQRSN